MFCWTKWMQGTHKLAIGDRNVGVFVKTCQNAGVTWVVYTNVTKKFLWAHISDICSNEKEGRQLIELITQQEFMGTADVMTNY